MKKLMAIVMAALMIMTCMVGCGKEEEKTRRLNPEMPIPPQATAVHHITDEDVKDAPTFRQIAKDLLRIFENCDIAGFNSNKFDVPLLMEEFLRCVHPTPQSCIFRSSVVSSAESGRKVFRWRRRIFSAV